MTRVGRASRPPCGVAGHRAPWTPKRAINFESWRTPRSRSARYLTIAPHPPPLLRHAPLRLRLPHSRARRRSPHAAPRNHLPARRPGRLAGRGLRHGHGPRRASARCISRSPASPPKRRARTSPSRSRRTSRRASTTCASPARSAFPIRAPLRSGHLPELLKSKPNNSPETALELPIDATVSGSVLQRRAGLLQVHREIGPASPHRLRDHGARLEAEPGALDSRSRRARARDQPPRRFPRFHRAGRWRLSGAAQ